MPNKSNTSVIRAISQAIQEIQPGSTLSYQKIQHAVTEALGISPEELTLYKRLFDFHLASGKYGERFLLNAIYDIHEDSFEVATFSFNGKELLEKKLESYSITDSKKMSKRGKQLRKFSQAMGMEVFWINANGKTKEELIPFILETIRNHPPLHHIALFDIFFSLPSNDKSLFSDEFLGIESHPLGITLITHTPPYLPMGISYYVGCTNNSELSRIKTPPIGKSNYSTIDLRIEGTFPQISTLQEENSIKLDYLNLLTSPQSGEHLVFEIIHSALNYQYERVKSTFTFTPIARRDRVTYPFQALNYSHTNIHLDNYRKHYPDKFSELNSDSKFKQGYFQVRSNLATSRAIQISASSTATNFIERAEELSELLKSVQR